MVGGRKVNPSQFKAPPSVALAGPELTAFKTEKARIDALAGQKVAQNGAVQAGG